MNMMEWLRRGKLWKCGKGATKPLKGAFAE